MGKVTVRWRDSDYENLRSVMKEEVFEGEKVGCDPGNAENPFLKIWADDNTFMVDQDRVILVTIEP